jgi:hypothetical protein
MPWLVKLPAGFGASRMQRELAALAVQRIARNDPGAAAAQLQRIEDQLQAGEKGWAWSQIGWQAAFRHMDEALAVVRQGGRRAALGRSRAVEGACRAACAGMGRGAFDDRENAAGARRAGAVGVLAWPFLQGGWADGSGQQPVPEDRRATQLLRQSRRRGTRARDFHAAEGRAAE